MSGSGRPSLLMWMEYVTSSPNSKKFGPPGGYSSGMKLARIVTVFGWSGLTNAYRSVLSAAGSLAIPGASRCDDMAFPQKLDGSMKLGLGDAPDLLRGAEDATSQVCVAMDDLALAHHHPHLARSRPDVGDDR